MEREPRRPVVSARQAAVIAENGPAIRDLDTRELERLLSWSEGVLTFEGEPLADVVREVARYTDVRIEIIDPELSELKIGGRFAIGDIDGLIRDLTVGLYLVVAVVGNIETDVVFDALAARMSDWGGTAPVEPGWPIAEHPAKLSELFGVAEERSVSDRGCSQ